MKIASYILILTFTVYLDFGGCSSGASGSGNYVRSSQYSIGWEPMISLNREVLVQRDRNKNLIDIMLRGGQRTPEIHPDMFILRARDKDNKFDYIVHYNEDGEAIALSPLNAQYLAILKAKKKARAHLLHPMFGGHLKVE